jgi:hypothetical protein
LFCSAYRASSTVDAVTLNWRELQLNDLRYARATRDDMRYTKGYLKPTLNNDESLAVVEKRFLAAHPDNDGTGKAEFKTAAGDGLSVSFCLKVSL